MNQFQEDLKTLEVDDNINEDNVTTRDVHKAFRKKAKVLHPDKAGAESTAQFQDFKNPYERALQYLVSRKKSEDSQADDESKTSDLSTEEKFTHDNFELFNFPKKNSDSFTINVENQLANLWQDCFDKLYGKPNVNKSKTSGTESGRLWKINFKYEEQSCELTIHFYNKPVKSKQSKFLVQGGSMAEKYIFVFDEMPKIYKRVCEMIL